MAQTATPAKKINGVLVNLLPYSILQERQRSSALRLTNAISIGLLVLMVFLTSATLVIRYMQATKYKIATKYLQDVSAQVTGLQQTDVQLATVQQYLISIKSLDQLDTKVKTTFNLIAFLAPNDIKFEDMSIGRDGSASISASTNSLASLDKFIASLSDKDKTGDLIAKVDMDGLNLGKDGTYRFSLKITLK